MLPVRPVNCGGTVGDGEFAGAPKKKQKKRKKGTKTTNKTTTTMPAGAKVFTLSGHDFFTGEPYSFLVPIPTTIESSA